MSTNSFYDDGLQEYMTSSDIFFRFLRFFMKMIIEYQRPMAVANPLQKNEV